MRKHHGLGLCKNVMDGMSRKLRLLTCHPYIPFNDIIPLSVEKKNAIVCIEILLQSQMRHLIL